MRTLREATLVALFGLTFTVAGCSASDKPSASSGGTGGTETTGGGGAGGGGGGTGGAECVTEICDGEDNNCDGVVDEGCECLVGDTEACYSGPAVTAGIGICKPGTRACDAATNKYGPCMGETLPAAAETCNLLDDDCNGTIDEGLPDLLCGIGACAVVAPACVNGQPGSCVPGDPTQEVCDGLDNNCNQLTDETFPDNGKACDSGLLGICAAGIMACLAATPTCVPNQMAGAELCDGLDNDCNGTVDDNIPGTGGVCSTGAPGVCGPGVISCQNGTVDCFSAVPASPEICDGLDNDCNGTADENNPEGGGACDTGLLGACAMGTLNCVQGGITCTPNALAQVEVCDGADNNCDGQVDEGNPGSGQACSCGGTTVCQMGQFFCQGCTKEVDCNNNKDDEGDGAIDCADTQCALGCDVNVPPCAAGEKLLVLASTDIPKGILDNTTVNSTISFSEVGVVKRVVLQLNINHTWDADLDITLKSPDATPVDVSSDNGGSSPNYTSTIFNDTCPTAVGSGAAPFNGCYSPEQPMGTFIGKSVQGAWTLAIGDDAGGDTGTLTSWTLAMCIQ